MIMVISVALTIYSTAASGKQQQQQWKKE